MRTLRLGFSLRERIPEREREREKGRKRERERKRELPVPRSCNATTQTVRLHRFTADMSPALGVIKLFPLRNCGAMRSLYRGGW